MPTPDGETPPSVPVDVIDDGLLWLVNAAVFHPRGFALAFDPETREFSLMGDGSERWTYDESTQMQSALDARFDAVERLMGRARSST